MLKADDSLFKNGGGRIEDDERGLFFIEEGLMKVERDPNQTITRSLTKIERNMNLFESSSDRLHQNSIGNLRARTGTIGKQIAFLKSTASENNHTKKFRLARFGTGWVVGALEESSGLRNSGLHVAGELKFQFFICVLTNSSHSQYSVHIRFHYKILTTQLPLASFIICPIQALRRLKEKIQL